MKKILCLCFSLLIISCGGKDVNYKTGKGDLILTITKDYIIIDSCTTNNGFNQSIWEFSQTISRSDTVACKKLMTRILERK
jgi:hypothetical protein